MFSFFRFFNRAYRPIRCRISLRDFKIAERSRISNSGLFLAMVLATVIGALAFFWSYLDAQYQFVGLNTRGRGIHAFNRLRSWLYYPSQPDYAATIAMGAGFLFSLILMMMRMRFLFWALAPCWLCGRSQLLRAGVLVFNLYQLVGKVNHSQIRWIENASKIHPFLSGNNTR